MRMSVAEYKRQMQELHANLPMDATYEWSSNDRYLDENGGVLPNFVVKKTSSWNGFLVHARVAISVTDFESEEDIEVQVSPHNIYRGSLETPDDKSILEQVRFYLRTDRNTYSKYVDGYVIKHFID